MKHTRAATSIAVVLCENGEKIHTLIGELDRERVADYIDAATDLPRLQKVLRELVAATQNATFPAPHPFTTHVSRLTAEEQQLSNAISKAEDLLKKIGK